MWGSDVPVKTFAATAVGLGAAVMIWGCFLILGMG